MRIVLIGPRGCGKTAVGRRLASRLGRRFIDLDELVLARFDAPTVKAIWKSHGEPAWRREELRVLGEALSRNADHVLALGGGTPMIAEAREALLEARRRGVVWIAYLHCPVEVLADRLSNRPGDRPSLTGRGTVEEIADVLAEREPTYRALADAVIDAAQEIDAVTAAIERAHTTQ